MATVSLLLLLGWSGMHSLSHWSSKKNDHNNDGIPDRVQIGSDGYLLPNGWYSSRQDPSWAPSVGYPDGRESIEILNKNSSFARGGTGKSYVSWRDATEAPTFRWNSDSILSQYFPSGLGQVYVSFWIKFDPNWTPLGETGASKLFRISSWDGVENIYGFGSDRYNGPVLFWDYKNTESGGVRNSLSFRGFPSIQIIFLEILNSSICLVLVRVVIME